jgi:hypothetical protein
VQHAISVGGCFRVVRNHHDRLAELAIELPQKPQDNFGILCVQISGWLISEYNLRLIDDGSRQRNPLLFASGKLPWPVLQTVRKPQHLCDHVETVGVKSVPVNMLCKFDIFSRIEGGQQIESLENESHLSPAEFCASRIPQRRQVISVEQYPASRGLGESTYHVQQGGFSASRGAHYGGEISRKNFQVDTAQRGNLQLPGAIDLPKVLGLEYGFQSNSIAILALKRIEIIVFAILRSGQRIHVLDAPWGNGSLSVDGGPHRWQFDFSWIFWFSSKILFVGEGLDGIFTAGNPGGVAGADPAANDRYHSGAQQPNRCYQNAQSREHRKK